jgi:hypothetical protein
LEGSSPGRDLARVRDTTGIEDRGMRIEGQLTNLGEPTVSLHENSRKRRGTGGPRALAMNEPPLLGIESRVTGRHKWKEAARYRAGVKANQAGRTEAVLAERSTEGRGEKAAAG